MCCKSVAFLAFLLYLVSDSEKGQVVANRSKVLKRTTKKGEVRWLARVWADRRRSVSKTFRRKEDAEAWATDTTSDANHRGRLVKPSKQLFGEYLLNWLTLSKSDLKPHTHEKYRLMIRRYIVDPAGLMDRDGNPLPENRRARGGRRISEGVKQLRLGERPLNALTKPDFQKLYNAMRDTTTGKGARSAQYLHAVLKEALKEAVADRKLAESPLEHLKRPRAKRLRDVITLSAAQVKRFLAALENHPLRAVWTLELRHGIRPGEALALTWRDITLEGELKTLRIDKTLNERSGSVAKAVGTPKTEASVREILLSADCVRVLAIHRLQAGERALDPDGIVFRTSNGTHYGLNNVRRAFKTLKQSLHEADRDLPEKQRFPLKITLYELRHTYATLMGDKGAPIAAVAQSMGHSSPMTTLKHYQRAAQDAALRLAQMSDDLEVAPPANVREGQR